MTSRRGFFYLDQICGPNRNPSSLRPVDARVRDGFPDILAEAHEGRVVSFYEDCIRGKVFVISFMSIDDEERNPVTATLAQTVKLLGDKVGREILVTSVTVAPQRDSLERLQDFAARFDAPPGWSFIRAPIEDTATLSQRLYHFNHGPGIGRLIFYGNGAARVWGSYPALVSPEDAAQRIGWLLPKTRPAGFRRAGPSKVGQNPNPWNNRAL